MSIPLPKPGNFLTRLLRPRDRDLLVAELYGRIVTQARQPGFFADHGVPDTVEGRFELLALHVWLVLHRLAGCTGAMERRFGQDLFDLMFADMDMNLREIGVGDMKIGSKVKEFASHFYGRVTAYEAALTPAAPADALAAALDRNLFGSTLPEPGQVALVERYVRAALAHLAEGKVAEILAGRVSFPACPPAVMAQAPMAQESDHG